LRDRRILRELQQRPDEQRRVERVAVHLPVDAAFAVEDAHLQQVIEARSRRLEAEAEVPGQRFQRIGFGSQEQPVRRSHGEFPLEGAHRARVVERQVKADRRDAETARAERTLGLAHRAGQELRGRRADRDAAGVNEIDHQRLAAKLGERYRFAVRVGEPVVGDRAADGRLAVPQCRFLVESFSR